MKGELNSSRSKEALNRDGERGAVRQLLDANDAGGLLGISAPRRSVRRKERNAKDVTGGVNAVGDEAEAVRRDIQSHRFFKPGNAFGAHANGNREGAVAGGKVASAVLDIRRRMKSAFEMNGHGRALLVVTLFAAQNASENFRLSVRLSRIIRKSDPQRHADAVMFMAGEQKSAAASIAGLALFDFLTEGRSPAKPHGETETHPAIQTSRHELHGKRFSWGKSKYIPGLLKGTSLRTKRSY